jgi:TRAP-type C4-dicarboxylate transport system substrate-binding protein
MVERLNASSLFKAVLYPDSQLGNATDVLDRCMAGDNVVTVVDPADFGDLTIPEIAAIEAPFLIQSYDQLDKIYASAWWKQKKAEVAAKGITILSEKGIVGDRHILTKKPIRTLADIKGMKIRVPTNVTFVAAFQAMGASPTPMSVGEIYTSLQQGIIDGLEHPYGDIIARKNYEVARYAVSQTHLKQPTMTICGTKFFDTLTEEQKNLLISSGAEAFEEGRRRTDENDMTAKTELQNAGIVFTDIDLKDFAVVTKGFFDYPDMKEWDPGIYDTLMAIMNK